MRIHLYSPLISLADRVDILIRGGRAIKKGGLDVENDLIHLEEGTCSSLLDELTKLLATCYIDKMRNYHCKALDMDQVLYLAILSTLLILGERMNNLNVGYKKIPLFRR